MMLAATDLGVGTGHSLVGDQAKARAVLEVPDTHFVAYLLGLGYPAAYCSQSASWTADPSTRWFTSDDGT